MCPELSGTLLLQFSRRIICAVFSVVLQAESFVTQCLAALHRCEARPGKSETVVVDHLTDTYNCIKLRVGQYAALRTLAAN